VNKLVAALGAAVLGCLLPASPARAAEPVLALHESFAAEPDGPAPTNMVGTEVPVSNFYKESSAAAPHVRNGFLTTAEPDTALGGSYRIAELDAEVTTVGASFAFTPYTRTGGLLCLSIQDDSIATAEPVPVSPLHFQISPTGWAVDVNAEAGTGVEPVVAHSFADPLTADGHTLHRVEIVLDRAAQAVRITLPDGTTETLTHEAFGLPGSHVYVEPFKVMASRAADRTDALVREWWADTRLVSVDAAVPPDPIPAPIPVPVPVSTPVLQAEKPQPPTATAPPVSHPEAPDEPRRVRAERAGRRIHVTWRRVTQADRYRVRCGTRATTVPGRRAVLRSPAVACSVRAVSEAGSSSWVKVRVRT
jgi:hypothetical protein